METSGNKYFVTFIDDLTRCCDVYFLVETTLDGNKYFVTSIDDLTRCCKVYFLKHKSEVF